MTTLTTTKAPGLLDPLKLGALQLPNRVIMAPLTLIRKGAESYYNCGT
jgi:2,4-dienoyl-CoA reductase-like NADH-dependent reductase (Old Yellow Enzyme family)